jgi:hypothetical protein
MVDRANQQEYNYEAETFEQALVMAVTDISNVRHRSRSLMGQYEHASPTVCAVVSSSVLTSSRSTPRMAGSTFPRLLGTLRRGRLSRGSAADRKPTTNRRWREWREGGRSKGRRAATHAPDSEPGPACH